MAPIPYKIEQKDNTIEQLKLELRRQQQINEELAETINKNKRNVQDALEELEGEIPDTPVQSDWNETDNTKQAFIKNKPTIPTVPTNVSAFTNDAHYISGSSPSSTFPSNPFVGQIALYEDSGVTIPVWYIGNDTWIDATGAQINIADE